MTTPRPNNEPLTLEEHAALYEESGGFMPAQPPNHTAAANDELFFNSLQEGCTTVLKNNPELIISPGLVDATRR